MEQFLLFLHKKNIQFKTKRRRLARFFPIKLYRKKIQNIILSRYAKTCFNLDNRTIYADKKDYLNIIVHNRYGQTAKLLKKFVKKETVVIDLGANIGYYTILSAELVGKTGHVYSFEPEPHNFSLLSKNIKTNNLTNVTLEQKGVADKNYQARLYLSDSNTDHRIYKVENDRKSVEIQVIKLDDYFPDGIKKPCFIKSDIQGADIKAIEGMKKLLQNSRDLILFFEYQPSMLKEFGSNPEPIINSLLTMGFTIFDTGHWTTERPQLFEKNKITDYSQINKPTSLFCIKQFDTNC